MSDFLTWVKAIWVTARGNPLDFEKRKYLVQIYQDQYHDIVYSKAAQMGLSERQLAEAVWIADQLSMNSLYAFPTQTHLQDFVQARLEPVLMSSEYLRARIDSGEKSLQKVGLKRIGKGHIYLRGSQNEKQIITIDADCIYLDERDRFFQANVAFLDKRLLASKLKWRREISTPTLPGVGIDKVYHASDQRIWQIQCPNCKLWQELDFFKNIDFEKRTTICYQCKTEVDRYSDGRWLVTNPKSKVHGYKINGIYNPERTIDDLLASYEEARVGGFSELQQFYNQTLGLPYDVSGETLTPQELNSCKRNYLFPVINVKQCYVGVDVGVKYLHVNVLQRNELGYLRLVWAGTVTKFLGPLDSIEAVLLAYDAKVVVIDKRPEIMKVREIMEAYPDRVWAAEYSNTKFTVQEYYKRDDIKHELALDRTLTIDYLIGDIRNQRIELPNNIEQVRDYFNQLLSSKRITEKNKITGVDSAKWVENGPDHYLHSLNLARMATQLDVGNQALVEYYTKPSAGLAPDFIDWIRVNGERIT